MVEPGVRSSIRQGAATSKLVSHNSAEFGNVGQFSKFVMLSRR